MYFDQKYISYMSLKVKGIADTPQESERLYPSYEQFLSKCFNQVLLGKVASR
jgi:hypothetical protein